MATGVPQLKASEAPGASSDASDDRGAASVSVQPFAVWGSYAGPCQAGADTDGAAVARIKDPANRRGRCS